MPAIGGGTMIKSPDHVVEVNPPSKVSTGETSDETLGWEADENRPLVGSGITTNTVGYRLGMSKVSMTDQTPELKLSFAHPRDSLKVEANLPRQFPFGSGSSMLCQPFFRSQQRRRRSLTDITLNPFSEREHSFRDDVGHAAAETYLVTRLTFTLLRCLGVGYRWIIKFAALGLYALFLMPGFIEVGCYYFFSKRVRRSIVYGEEERNRLDLYLPENLDNPKPVVAFVTGGAWIIGYKAWGALLGRQLVERDVIVACIDYRNFPQGTITDMVKDASQGIAFICSNIAEYGGDPNRIYLAGQSAGAHIAACVLVEQAKKEMGIVKAELTWRLSQLKAYLAISGGYNLLKLVDYFHNRGLYRSIFLSIMEGEISLPRFSPEVVVQIPSFLDAASLLPPFYLFHGMADYSIPCDASTTFAKALASVDAQVEVKLYPNKTHTDLFLQDPMRGGYDSLLSDILAVVHAGDAEAEANDAVAPPRRRMVPEILLRLARKVSPF